jgi:hypothetical protein
VVEEHGAVKASRRPGMLANIVVSFVLFLVFGQVFGLVAAVMGFDITVRNSLPYRICDQREGRTLYEFVQSVLMPFQPIKEIEPGGPGREYSLGLVSGSACGFSGTVSSKNVQVGMPGAGSSMPK